MGRAITGGWGGNGMASSWAADSERALMSRKLATTGEQLDASLHDLAALRAGLEARHIDPADIASTGESVLARMARFDDTLGDPDFLSEVATAKPAHIGYSTVKIAQTAPASNFLG